MIGLMIISCGAIYAQIPALNSRPGAAYTMYLNFGGFNFTGTWGGGVSDPSPLATPAYSIDVDTGVFSATEIANMRNIWSRVAEKYAILNINVTTVDPALSLPVYTDPNRQAFYDQTPRLMHTVIGGSGGWTMGGGISYVGVADTAFSTAGINSNAGRGYHTNFVFAGQSPSNLQFVAEATAHEDGHGLNLDHQSRWTGANATPDFVYDPGSGTGTGSFAPIMGNSYNAQRGLWRIGATESINSATAQNDLAVLRANAGIIGNGIAGFMDSGIGHTTATATALPLTGATINSTLAAGLIAPLSSTMVALGENNYTTDLFTFTVSSAAALLNVNLVSGRSTITAGVADPGATLNATLRLLSSSGTTIMTANSGVLLESLSTSLAPGQYFLQVSSAGGGTNNGYNYFDVGSYFLTGSIVAVPEPGMLAIGCFIVVGLVVCRRRLFNKTQASTSLSDMVPAYQGC